MPKLKQLEDKIRKLVQELMELSFGCKVITLSGKLLTFVRWKENNGTIRRNFRGQNLAIEPQWKYTGIYIQENGKEYFLTFTKKSKTKIIGHEIQLHHVLKAVTKEQDVKEFAGIAVDNNGLIFQWKEGVLKFTKQQWNLSKPLSGQSEETIEFLLKLLTSQHE